MKKNKMVVLIWLFLIVNFSIGKALTIRGLVKQPLDLELKDLTKFSPYTVHLTEVTQDGKYHGAFTYIGVSLRYLLELSNIQKKNFKFFKPIDLAIVIKNKEGKSIVLSWGEVFYKNPGNIILAYYSIPIKPHFLNCDKCHRAEFIRSALNQLERKIEFPKLIIAKEFFTGRCLEKVTSIKVVSIDEATEYRKINKLYSNKIIISERLSNKTLKIKKLPKGNRVKVKVKMLGEGRGYHGIKEFEGIPLKNILQNLSIKPDLNKVVIVYGIDGYRSVFSMGEIFLNSSGKNIIKNIIIADKVNGQPIKNGGKFVLVSPEDNFVDRMVKAVFKIEIISLRNQI